MALWHYLLIERYNLVEIQILGKMFNLEDMLI